MRALDTNVLVRFFVDDADDPQASKQRPAAVQAMAQRVFVPSTVLLEFEWVLHGFYAMPRRDIALALRALASIEHVVFDDRRAVLNALDAFDAGLDFADALHLSQSARATTLLTFDKRFASRASRLQSQPAVELLP